MRKLLLAVSFFLIASIAKADCVCMCVNGKYTSVCEKQWEYNYYGGRCGYQYCPAW